MFKTVISSVRSLYSHLVPSGDEFVGLFKQQSAVSLRASACYQEYFKLDSTKNSIEEQKIQLIAIEKEGDVAERKIKQALHSTYMVPFDREHITQLASTVDTTIDNMKDTLVYIKRHNIRTEPDMIEMATIAFNCANDLDRAISMLGSMREDHDQVKSLCDSIRAYEKQADRLFDKACDRLFDKTVEQTTLDNSNNQISETEKGYYEKAYELMEDVVDAYEDAAGVLEDILIDLH